MDFKKRALQYEAINDMDLELKKEIMRLTDSPEWKYHQTLVELLEVRSHLDDAIAFLVAENTANFDNKISAAKTSIAKVRTEC